MSSNRVIGCTFTVRPVSPADVSIDEVLVWSAHKLFMINCVQTMLTLGEIHQQPNAIFVQPAKQSLTTTKSYYITDLNDLIMFFQEMEASPAHLKKIQ
jgi:hypothetical protein